MWFSRLSPGSDIQTLHLTPSSTQYSIGEKKYLPPSCNQYSIGDIYSEYSMLCIPVSFEKRLEGFCLIGGGGEDEDMIWTKNNLMICTSNCLGYCLKNKMAFAFYLY